MFALVKLNVTVTDIQGNESQQDIIKLFAPYTVWEDKNGTQHAPDALLSLTSTQKQDLGIYDVAYEARPDDSFYTVTENAPEFDAVQKIVKITYTSTGKDLEDDGDVKGLKSNWISTMKGISNSLLSNSDWMLVRKIERDVDVPSATTTYRSAVVTEANRLETAISAATDVEELITAVESASWPTAE
jgi:hypothetical protein